MKLLTELLETIIGTALLIIIGAASLRITVKAIVGVIAVIIGAALLGMMTGATIGAIKKRRQKKTAVKGAAIGMGMAIVIEMGLIWALIGYDKALIVGGGIGGIAGGLIGIILAKKIWAIANKIILHYQL